MQSKKVGLALSGGVLRGPAHIGVLKVLTRAGLRIDFVAGSSAGSLIGAGYCAGIPLDELEQAALEMRWRDIARPVWPRKGLVSFEKLETFLIQFAGDLRFEELPVPLAVVATDLDTGGPMVIRTGRVAPAVHASCAVPGFVVPVEREGRVLGDGGASNNLPSGVVREMGAEIVIGVDLFQPTLRRRLGPLGIGMGAIEMLVRGSGGGLLDVDCLIVPDLAGLSYVRTSQAARTVRLGEAAAQASLDGIMRAVAA